MVLLIGFCFAYFCQKRQAASLSFSYAAIYQQGSGEHWLGTSSRLEVGDRDTARAHRELLRISSLADMLRPAGKALSFWPAVNPIEQQPWLGHAQHFFCLKDDLVSKGQIVELPKNN